MDVSGTVREVMSGIWGDRKRDYLGASNTISTRETTATRSTLQGEEHRPVSSHHHRSTGGALGAEEEGHKGGRGGAGGHLHVRQEVRAGRWVQAHHGLLVFLLLQQGQGDLELQQGPGVGREGVALVRGHKPRSL